MLPARVSVILVIAAGWFSQRLLARGVSSRVARGIFGGACVALGGAAMAIMPDVPSISAKIGLTTIGVALPSVIYVMGNAVVSEIAPVSQRGAMLAIGTAVSTSAGLLAPYVMGSVVETAATARRLQHRLYDLRCHHADRWRDRDGADAPRARGDAVGEGNTRGGSSGERRITSVGSHGAAAFDNVRSRCRSLRHRLLFNPSQPSGPDSNSCYNR